MHYVSQEKQTLISHFLIDLGLQNELCQTLVNNHRLFSEVVYSAGERYHEKID